MFDNSADAAQLKKCCVDATVKTTCDENNENCTRETFCNRIEWRDITETGKCPDI